jgi:citrate lyase subunit beta/citryl-CoA lyase
MQTTEAPRGDGAGSAKTPSSWTAPGCNEDAEPQIAHDSFTLIEGNKKCASITIRLSKTECDQLRKRAAQAGLTVSAYLRSCTFEAEALRAQVKDVLAALGVPAARVKLEDSGALPWTLTARLETAVRRAGTGAGREAGPVRTAPLPAPTPRDRLRRSRLYLPGNEPKFMINAGLHGADGLIFDLEDSVHPAEKDAARHLVRAALRAVDCGGAERMVRINQLPLGLEDLATIVPEHPDLILIPKVETAAQVAEVDHVINEISARTSTAGTARPLWLMPILESALGIENAFAIATASPRVAALTIGLEDYTADLGVVKTRDGAETQYARLRLVNAARAAGLQAIDSVYGDVADLDGLTAWAARARSLGFEGMGCVHPRQIQVIHTAFAPSAAEIERALRVEAAFRDAHAKGLGVVSLGAKMIDPPVVERARKLVERARRMGLVPAAPAEER